MGVFDTILGLTKLGSNFFGGGSGKTEKTNATTASTTNQTSKSNTSANRREYSDGMLNLLELGSADALARSALRNEKLDSLGSKPAMDFDAEAYIAGITQSASNTIDANRRSNTNQIAGQTGGSANGNSQAALLADRMSRDAAATMAGVTAEATGSAAQIASDLRAQQTNELLSATSSGDANLTTLLNALRGGETYQEVDGTEVTTANSSGTTASTTRVPFNWTAGLGNIFKDVNQT